MVDYEKKYSMIGNREITFDDSSKIIRKGWKMIGVESINYEIETGPEGIHFFIEKTVYDKTNVYAQVIGSDVYLEFMNQNGGSDTVKLPQVPVRDRIKIVTTRLFKVTEKDGEQHEEYLVTMPVIS